MLAARGLNVVVLEAAGYYNESDFTQLELPAYQQMFWRGGPNPTADGNVSLVAGTDARRRHDHQLDELPAHAALGARAVGAGAWPGGCRRRRSTTATSTRSWERISANDGCSDLNGTQQRLREGAEALGWSFETIVRNTDAGSYTPESAGYLGFGDQSGSKRSADRTWLADAQEHGARFLTFTRATKVLTEDGRASGVEAVWQTPRRPQRQGDREGAARRRRLRLAGVAGAAASLGHRRPGGRGRTCGCIPRASSAGPTAPTRRPGGGAAGRASATSSRTPARAMAS